MKFSVLLIFFIVLLPARYINAQQFNDAVSYLEFINTENDLINNNVWQYTKAVAHETNPGKIENTRKELIKQIEESKKKILNITSYNNDDDYKNQFINFLNIYENIMNNDYANIVNMKEIAEQSYDYMEAYILMQEQVDKKMEQALDSIHMGMVTFTKKYDIKLLDAPESDLAKKMKISNDVFQHKNDIYLPFFKANFQEGELIEGLSSNNVGIIQQKASTLSQFAHEGLDSLSAIAPYKKDNSLIMATKNILLFYVNEAEVKVPEMINFFLMKDKLDKLRETIENKKASERNNEEIQEYNKLVEQMNQRTELYNKTNNELNKTRSNLLAEWEKTSSNFLSRHIPKN